MTRFVDLPFAYQAVGIPKGKRARVARVFADKVTVTLTEADDVTAPLVALVDGVPFRRCEDGFLTPAKGEDGRKLSADRLVALLQDKRRSLKWIAYPLREREDGLPYDPIEASTLTDDFRVSSTERELRAGHARLAASRMRLINGYLWRSVPEPFIAVYTKGLGVVGDVEVGSLWRVKYLLDGACFRLDELGQAVDYATAIAGRYGRRAPKVATTVQLSRPDLLSFDASRAMADLIAYRLRPEQREYELSAFMLDKDPVRKKVAELFRAIDNYGTDPTAVLAATHRIMAHRGRSVCADLLRQSTFPLLAAPLARWATSVGAARELGQQEAAALSAIASL